MSIILNKSPTVSYNLLLPLDQYNKLKEISINESMKNGKMVSMAQLIRDIIDKHLEKSNNEANT